MENQLRIFLVSGIVIVLTDYLKIFGEETRKNKKIIRDFIKCILISLVIIIVFAIINFYSYQTHLFYEFSDKDLDQYAVVFAANTVFLMVLNSLLNWADRLVSTLVYSKGKNNTNVEIIKNILRGVICIFIFFTFSYLASQSKNNKYKIFKQDTTVKDCKGNEYLVKENSTFDFNYDENDSEKKSSSNLNYESANSIFQLETNSKIKLLKGSILFPKKGEKIIYRKDGKNLAKDVTILSTPESIMSLENDETFTLFEDTNISLATQNENKFILEVQLELIGLFYAVFYFVKAIYVYFILSAKGPKNSKNNEWKFSEQIAFFTSETMTDEKMYDKNSFENDKNKRNYDNDTSQIIKCEKGDIVIDSELYDATIVSDNNNGKNRISSEFILLKLKDDNVSVEYILFIVNNFLKSASDRKLDKEGLINDLSNLKINLPWKSYQKIVGNEYKVYLQKMDQLERYYKDTVKE